jgi:hypothetical protein
VFLFVVAFSNPTADRKILTFTRHCSVQINQLPLYLQKREKHSLPHLEHDS